VNSAELTGRARTHIAALGAPGESPVALHVQAAVPFANLRRRARAAGIDLAAVSAFRDFDRQLAIWNGKYRGERPLHDAAGRPLNAGALAEPERIDAILLWSALPGASRHHWGTDVDLIDRAAIAPDAPVRLTPAEYAPGGPFAPLAAWLAEHAAHFGFFRPYRGTRSGVQAEPWHFSFAPLAQTARRAATPAVLRQALEAAPLLGKAHVLGRLEELHARYVAAIDPP
jgi:LAS superfamily LD-carboxypeptidase LdcB